MAEEIEWKKLPFWAKILLFPVGLAVAIVGLALTIVIMCVYLIVVLLEVIVRMLAMPFTLGFAFVDMIYNKLRK